MHLVIVSGMSGAGKSQALNTLEDQGYYCIDNLPLELFASAFETKSFQKQQKIAIGIDIRSGGDCLLTLDDITTPFKEKYKVDIVYLYASKAVLIKRYDETRHKHPLSDTDTTLREALIKEYELLAPVRELADIQIDTSLTTIYELASQIITRICNNRQQPLSLMFQSFGFKYGTPRDSDFLFDVRCLPNPYWIPELRCHTGMDKEIIEWLSSQELVIKMEKELISFIDQWVPHIIDAQRSYLTVSIGCTGGHHRSVYLTEQLAKYFSKKYKDSVITKHRELDC